MRTVAALALFLTACGGNESKTSVPKDQFCAAVVAAACDREVPCGAYPDRSTCMTDLTDAFDGCPLAVQAVALQEAGYDPAAAARYVDGVRRAACGTAAPDPIGEYPVFSPQLGAGEICHSDVSCTPGLTCQDVTVTNPQGICTAVAAL